MCLQHGDPATSHEHIREPGDPWPVCLTKVTSPPPVFIDLAIFPQTAEQLGSALALPRLWSSYRRVVSVWPNVLGGLLGLARRRSKQPRACEAVRGRLEYRVTARGPPALKGTDCVTGQITATPTEDGSVEFTWLQVEMIKCDRSKAYF